MVVDPGVSVVYLVDAACLAWGVRLLDVGHDPLRGRPGRTVGASLVVGASVLVGLLGAPYYIPLWATVLGGLTWWLRVQPPAIRPPHRPTGRPSETTSRAHSIARPPQARSGLRQDNTIACARRPITRPARIGCPRRAITGAPGADDGRRGVVEEPGAGGGCRTRRRAAPIRSAEPRV